MPQTIDTYRASGVYPVVNRTGSLEVIREPSLPMAMQPGDDSIADSLVDLVQNFVSGDDSRAERLRLSGHADPEDDSKRIILTVGTRLDAERAMSAWSALGQRIEEWLVNQPEPIRNRVVEHFTTDFTRRPGS